MCPPRALLAACAAPHERLFNSPMTGPQVQRPLRQPRPRRGASSSSASLWGEKVCGAERGFFHCQRAGRRA
jgi:hypothetical protein